MSLYEPHNILITGGCGFIASHFINYIYDKLPNINIINIDAMYYCANVENIKKSIRYSNRYKFIKGNICSQDLVYHILEEHNIDTIMHFAAQSHVDNSFSNPIQYTKDNVLGTHTLLECSRKFKKIKRFVHVSTDEVYGESMLMDTKKDEQSILCPTNPYAATKAAAELIAKAYYFSYKLPIIITRGNNVYGPRQYPEKVIPKFLELLQMNERLTIHGNGLNIRSFLYVDDVSSAFEIVLLQGIIGEIYNIGSNDSDECTILDLAKLIIKLVKNSDKYEEWVEYVDDRLFNDKRYYISNDKIKKLGWTIKTSLYDGLIKTIDSTSYT